MKITDVELHPTSFTTGTEERVSGLCARAKELEEAGKFEDARAVLSDFWQRIGDRPKLNGLDQPQRAELLLRVGTLSGWLGSARQIPGAQEIAKDLISESSGVFGQLGLVEKVAETQVDLGICYWREGALDEARITFDAALHTIGDIQSQQRLRALLNKAIVEEVSSRSKEALRILSEAEPLFLLSTNHALRGKFHLEYATELKNLGLAERREDYIDRSLMQYTAASVELEQAGHERFLALVENNLGFLFVHLGRFQEAHQHLDRAVAMAQRLNDKGYRSQFEDTRARAFLGQGQLDQAEKMASSAVKGFREGDEQSNLSAALTTHATVLARKGRQREALTMFDEAVSVAAQGGDPETGGIASLAIIEELGATLSPEQLKNYYRSAESALKHSQHDAIRFRLGQCARKLMVAESSPSTSGVAADSATEPAALTGSLEEQVLQYEANLIRQALESSDGSITRAARLLGVTHQGLAFILNGRQKSLLSARKPAKPRRRSIIRYH
jgi:tetratricopeptide (TPR) repeat protein